MKYIILLLIITNIYASEKAKLLLVDKNIYEKINNINILNGGINKKYIILNTNLSSDDLKSLYKEYYLYNGEKCNMINKVSITNINTLQSDVSVAKNYNKQDIVKRIKLLQILVDNPYNKEIPYGNISNNILNLGFICDNTLVFKNKEYKIGDNISNNKINLIDKDNSIIYLIKDNS